MTEENKLANANAKYEEDEKLVEWTQDQVKKRSKELQLVDESGKCILPKIENRKTSDQVRSDDVNSNEIEEESKSASTTSDSQVCI